MNQKEFLEMFIAKVKSGVDLETLWKDCASKFGWLVKDRLARDSVYKANLLPNLFCRRSSRLVAGLHYSLRRRTLHTVTQDKILSLAPGDSRPNALPAIKLETQVDVLIAQLEAERYDLIERALDLVAIQFRDTINEAFVRLVTHLAVPLPQQQTPFWESLEDVVGAAPKGVLFNCVDYSRLPKGCRESMQGLGFVSRHAPRGKVFILPQPKEFMDFLMTPEIFGHMVTATRGESHGQQTLGYKVHGEFSLLCWGEKPPVIVLNTEHAKP